ncbi:hypothetical protein RvY_16050 [Ramazzottius varieornatus]|uniref:Uncharacterized protein n=1 Tax=Ramazzottius varieornatus TaxID=947166 RepID=A0A1D1VX34_RAMVA|nr:hypothetical protein RvY_16050 [Ramazzottius varieornatus]
MRDEGGPIRISRIVRCGQSTEDALCQKDDCPFNTSFSPSFDTKQAVNITHRNFRWNTGRMRIRTRRNQSFRLHAHCVTGGHHSAEAVHEEIKAISNISLSRYHNGSLG